MAGLPWIKVWTAVRDHPKVQRLEKELRLRDALGVVVRLWCWTADYHPDGEIPEADGSTAAKAARGDATRLPASGVLSALVSSGFLDSVPGGFRVHDWEDMQTTHVEADERRKCHAAERQQRYRVRHGNALRNASRNGDVTHASVTEKEREKEKEILPSPARLRSTPEAAGEREQAGKLGPLGQEFVQAVQQGLGYGLVPAKNGQAEELESCLGCWGGVEPALDFVAATCRKRDVKPKSVAWLVKVLGDAAGPEVPQ